MRDAQATSQDASAKSVEPAGLYEFAARLPGGDPDLAALLRGTTTPRGLLDVDDPLEGCDATAMRISFGRVGDPAGTHTREQMQRATIVAFGYQPAYVPVWSEAHVPKDDK